MWISKKKFNNMLNEANSKVASYKVIVHELTETLDNFIKEYPFDLGQIVYELQLRNAKGRFTKTKPSREHSSVVEVVVDEKNYFKLVSKLEKSEIFKDKTIAENYLLNICVD